MLLAGTGAGSWEIGDISLQRYDLAQKRYDLAQKKVTRTIPWPRGEKREGVGFAMARDRKRGYGLMQQIGRYKFWACDLTQRLLHVFQAGATIDVYDSSSYKLLRTIEMNADQTTNLFILPRK